MMDRERVERMLKRAGPTTNRMARLVMDEPGHTAAWYIEKIPMRLAQFHLIARKYGLEYTKHRLSNEAHKEYKMRQPMEGMDYATAKLLAGRGRLGS